MQTSGGLWLQHPANGRTRVMPCPLARPCGREHREEDIRAPRDRVDRSRPELVRPRASQPPGREQHGDRLWIAARAQRGDELWIAADGPLAPAALIVLAATPCSSARRGRAPGHSSAWACEAGFSFWGSLNSLVMASRRRSRSPGGGRRRTPWAAAFSNHSAAVPASAATPAPASRTQRAHAHRAPWAFARLANLGAWAQDASQLPTPPPTDVYPRCTRPRTRGPG